MNISQYNALHTARNVLMSYVCKRYIQLVANIPYTQLRFQLLWFWWRLHNSTRHIQTVERYWCLEMTS